MMILAVVGLAASTLIGPPAPAARAEQVHTFQEQRATPRLQLGGIALGAALLDYASTQRGRAAGLHEQNAIMGDGGAALLIGKGVAAAVYVGLVPVIERRSKTGGRIAKWGIPLSWVGASILNHYRTKQAEGTVDRN